MTPTLQPPYPSWVWMPYVTEEERRRELARHEADIEQERARRAAHERALLRINIAGFAICIALAFVPVALMLVYGTPS